MIDTIQNFARNHKIMFLICVIDFLAVIIFLIIVIYKNVHPVAMVDIVFTPASATLTINGKKYQSGQYKMDPGNISVTLSKEDFKAKTISYDLSENHTTKIYIYLTDNNDSLDYYKTNSSDFELLERVADDDARSFINYYRRAIAIKEDLPIEKSEYYSGEQDGEFYRYYAKNRVTDGNKRAFSDCVTNLCLYCDTTGADNLTKTYFEDMIRDAGYNPNDYEIIYQDGIQ